jgi:hypothetical protein
MIERLERLLMALLHLGLGGMLLWALDTMPLEYYVLLQCVVFVGSLAIAWWWRRSFPLASFAALFFALLFNPFTSWPIERNIWMRLDIFAAVVFGLSSVAYAFRFSERR